MCIPICLYEPFARLPCKLHANCCETASVTMVVEREACFSWTVRPVIIIVGRTTSVAVKRASSYEKLPTRATWCDTRRETERCALLHDAMPCQAERGARSQAV